MTKFDPKSSTERRGVRGVLGSIGMVGCSIVGALIGLALAFGWIVALDVVARQIGKVAEQVLGERGLGVLLGVALAVSGCVILVLMLRRRPGMDLALRQWLLSVGFSVVVLLAGVVLLFNAFATPSGSVSPGF